MVSYSVRKNRKADFMSKEKLRKLHLIYGIVLSCIIVITGICFIVSCIDIYRSGARPFTYESINSHFMAIVVPVILCIVGIIGGMVISFFPLEKPKIKGIIDTGTTLRKMLSYKYCHGEVGNKVRKEHELRKNAVKFSIAVNSICFAISLIYTLNKNNFPANDINGEMVSAMLFVIPCTIVGLASIYAVALIRNASYAKELEITKNALKNAKNKSYEKITSVKLNANGSVALKAKHNVRVRCDFETTSAIVTPIKLKKVITNPTSLPCEKSMLGARLTLAVIAVVFIVVGIFNGGMADVLQKAINICTECIGLG